jgi:hypothetical protein
MDSITARLFNFAIGEHELKFEHENWLNRFVVGFLQVGGSLWLGGLAGRLDSGAPNLLLALRRADAVVAFLRKQCPNDFRISIDLTLSDRAVRTLGVPDDEENEDCRAVFLTAWSRPYPPPPAL